MVLATSAMLHVRAAIAVYETYRRSRMTHRSWGFVLAFHFFCRLKVYGSGIPLK
jgi:hypothetical protein